MSPRLLIPTTIVEAAPGTGTSTVTNVTRGKTLTGRKIPPKLLDLVKAGGIYPLLEKEGLIGRKA